MCPMLRGLVLPIALRKLKFRRQIHILRVRERREVQYGRIIVLVVPDVTRLTH